MWSSSPKSSSSSFSSSVDDFQPYDKHDVQHRLWDYNAPGRSLNYKQTI